MLILGISGSPIKEGKVTILLNTVLERAKELGAETDIIFLIEQNVPYCVGCYSKDKSLCNPQVFKEVLPRVYEKILKADGLVFGTPVYWFGPSGLMKNFIDLLTALDNLEPLIAGKVVSCVVSCEEDGAISTASSIIIPLNFMGAIIPPYSITYAVGSIDKNTDTLFECDRIAKNMVEIIKRTKSLKGEFWFKP
ncbi:MAG: NAD(P)H-dependent oxidoreductase [Candidatus Hydrothermales bacterium]